MARVDHTSSLIAELERANPDAWRIDEESDAGVMLPLDVARAVRQQALAALGVSGRSTLPPAANGNEDAGDVLGSVLSAQWTASRVAGGVPIRFRELPRPFVEESVLAVSFSGIDSYQACPRQFFYGHVLHIDARSGGASTTLGSKVHGALLALNRRWMDQGMPPPDEEVHSTSEPSAARIPATRSMFSSGATAELIFLVHFHPNRVPPSSLVLRLVVHSWQIDPSVTRC